MRERQGDRERETRGQRETERDKKEGIGKMGRGQAERD